MDESGGEEEERRGAVSLGRRIGNETVGGAASGKGGGLGVTRVGERSCLERTAEAEVVSLVSSCEGAASGMGWGLGVTVVGKRSCWVKAADATVRGGKEEMVDVVGGREGWKVVA